MLCNRVFVSLTISVHSKISHFNIKDALNLAICHNILYISFILHEFQIYYRFVILAFFFNEFGRRNLFKLCNNRIASTLGFVAPCLKHGLDNSKFLNFERAAYEVANLNTDLAETLHFIFQCCIPLDCSKMLDVEIELLCPYSMI